MAKATVFHPTTGERKAVTVGDPNAFAGGFVLETPTDNFKIRSAGKAPIVTPPSPATPPGSLEGTLSTKEDKFDDLKTVARKASELAFSQGGGARRGLETAKTAGIDLFNPANIRGAIETGASLKADIKDIYGTTLDRITKMEENRKEGSEYIAQLASEVPKFFQQLTPDEITFIQKTGFINEATAAKLAQFRLDNPESNQAFVEKMMLQYPDAGIAPGDSVEATQDKIVNNSKLYKQDVRLADVAPGGDGTTPVADYSKSEKKKLEQHFGSDWVNGSTRQEQLDFLFGEDPAGLDLLTDDDRRVANNIGIGTWSDQAIGMVLDSFTPSERTQFIRDFKDEQQRTGMSLDPTNYALEWAREKDLEEDDEDLQILEKFFNQDNEV